MADYSNPGEFQGTLGQQQDLFSVSLSSFGTAVLVVRPGFVITSPTNSAGVLELFQSTPPVNAFGVPVFIQGGATGITVASGGTANVTVLNSAGQFGTVSTSRTWTLTSGGDSILAHLDAPISVAFPATQNVLVLNSAGQFGTVSTSRTWTLASGGDSVTAHLDAPVAFPATQNVLVLNSAGQFGTVSTSRTWTLSSSGDSVLVHQDSPVVVNQGTNPWTVQGSITLGASNPIFNMLPVLPALVSNLNPVLTDGTITMVSLDARGGLRTTVTPTPIGVSQLKSSVYLQYTNTADNGNTGWTALATSAPFGVGDLILLAIGIYGNQTITSVTETSNPAFTNNLTQIASAALTDNGQLFTLYLYYGYSEVAAGTGIVTVVTNGIVGGSLSLAVYRNARLIPGNFTITSGGGALTKNPTINQTGTVLGGSIMSAIASFSGTGTNVNALTTGSSGGLLDTSVYFAATNIVALAQTENTVFSTTSPTVNSAFFPGGVPKPFAAISVEVVPLTQPIPGSEVSILSSVGVSASQAGPWNVTNSTSVGTITTTPLGSVGVFAQQAGTWNIGTLTAITSSVGVSATQAGTWNVGAITSSVGVSATIVGQPITVIPTSSIGGLSALGAVSALNSSMVLLGANATFTGTFEEVSGYATVSFSAFSDVAGTVSTQWSGDGINVDVSDTTATFSSSGRAFSITPRARFFRISYTNGAIAQNLFRLNTTYHFAGAGLISRPLDRPLTADNYAQQVRAVVAAQSAGTSIGNVNAYTFPLQGSTTSTGTELGMAVRSRGHFGNKATYSASTVQSVGASVNFAQSIAYLLHPSTDAKRYQINRIRVSAMSSTGSGMLGVLVARITSDGLSGGGVGGITVSGVAHDPADVASSGLFRTGVGTIPVRVTPDVRSSILATTPGGTNEFDFAFSDTFEGKPLICLSGTSGGWEVRVKPLTTLPTITSVACSFVWTEELATTQ